MKKSEFIKEVEDLGFNAIEVLRTGFEVRTKNGERVLSVGSQTVLKIDCFYSAYDKLLPYTREKLFNLAVEYAKTPVDEREFEKKYYIKLKGFSEGMNYLNYSNDDGTLVIHNKERSNFYETQFTLKEISEYDLEKFVSNELFELIEVK